MTFDDDAPAARPTPPGGNVSGRRSAIEKTRQWIELHRWELLLLGPASAYLALAMISLFGWLGLPVAAAVVASIPAISAQVPADTWLSLYRAEPVAPAQAQGLRLAISTLSDRAGLSEEPALAIVPSLSVGAFSVGTGSRFAIFMTEGLLRRMSLRDLVTLAAHEIGHIRSGHIKVFAIADVMTRIAQLLYYAGIALLVGKIGAWFAGETFAALTPIALLLSAPALNSALQLALPREHDFSADRYAAFLQGSRDVIVKNSAAEDRGHFTDDLRLPVPQRRIPLPSPLRCAPPWEKREAVLKSAPPPVLLPPLTVADEPMISLLGFGPVEMRPRNRWPGIWF